MKYYKMYNKKQFSKKLLKETKKLGLYPSDKEIGSLARLKALSNNSIVSKCPTYFPSSAFEK